MEMKQLLAVTGFHHNRKRIEKGEAFEATTVDAAYLITNGQAVASEVQPEPAPAARRGTYANRNMVAAHRAVMDAAPPAAPEQLVMTTQVDPMLAAPPAEAPTEPPPAAPAEQPAAEQPSAEEQPAAAPAPPQQNYGGGRGGRGRSSSNRSNLTPDQLALVTDVPKADAAE